MQGAVVKVQKVDDGAEAQPVDDVADRPADDQTDCDGKERARRSAEPIDQDRDDCRSREGKDQGVQSCAAVEQSKADAAIIRQGKVEERRHRLAAAEDALAKKREDCGFAELVE